MENGKPVLFENKSNCCACGACVNICPKGAIKMIEDEYGYIYPKIDYDNCVACGKCRKVCHFQNTEVKNSTIRVFASVAKDDELVLKSASGGIFATLAKTIIENGGFVFGAAFNSEFDIVHRKVSELDELYLLQGSKYAQSYIGKSYCETRELLEQGKTVLFSGTPCQIHGLYGFLGKDYERLMTIDIICHGVPSNRMFKDYLLCLENKYGGKIKNFTFRDKRIGWGINGSFVIKGKRYKLWQSSSSYLYYFMKGWIYRENCYNCKYTSMHRPADITVGDYWGIEKQHSDYLGRKKWDESKGISAIIINTDKGLKFIENFGTELELKESAFDKVAYANAQLCAPCAPGPRHELMDKYKLEGWNGMEKIFRNKIGMKYYSSQIKSLIPNSIKRFLKRVM